MTTVNHAHHGNPVLSALGRRHSPQSRGAPGRCFVLPKVCLYDRIVSDDVFSGKGPGYHEVAATNSSRTSSLRPEPSRDQFVQPQQSGSSEPRTLMFAGGGFPAFWYNLGQAMATRSATSEPDAIRTEGWSAGAMVATLFHFLPELSVCRVLGAAALARKTAFPPHMGEAVRSLMNNLLPEDATSRVNGRLGIVVCRRGRGEIIDHWESKDELVNCIVASVYVPGIAGLSLSDPVYGSVDGGLSTNLGALSEGKEHVDPPRRAAGIRGLLQLLLSFWPLTPREALGLYEKGMAAKKKTHVAARPKTSAPGPPAAMPLV